MIDRDIKPPNVLDVRCPICSAKPGVRCGSLVDASKYFDVPHAGRVELAKRSA